MVEVGLKQLIERFNKYMVLFEQLEGRHNLKTYKELADISKALKYFKTSNAKSVNAFQSTVELDKELSCRLEEHKRNSILGITKGIDNILDRISERQTCGRRTDRLEGYFDLLVNYCIPRAYHDQKDAYLDELDNVKYCGDEVRNAYSEVA